MNLKARKKLLSILLSAAMAASSLSGLAWAEVIEEDLPQVGMEEESFIYEEEPDLLEESVPEILDEDAESADILEEVTEEEADEAAESVEEAAEENIEENTEENAEEEPAEPAADEEAAEEVLLTDEPEMTADSDEETDYNFQLADVESILPHWNHLWINKTANVWVRNQENPDGTEMEYQVYDVQAKNSDASKPSVEIQAEDNGWRILINENPGEATITQYYYDIHGKKQTHTSKVIVVNELWTMSLEPETGNNEILTGEKVTLDTNMEHWSFDEDGHHRLPTDGLTFEWISEDAKVLKIQPNNDGTAVISALDTQGRDVFTGISCKAYFTRDGKKVLAAEGWCPFHICGEYKVLLPERLEQFHVGKDITIYPQFVRHYRDRTESNHTEQVEEVRYRWYFWPEELEIKDKDGKILTCDKDSGEFSYTEGCVGKDVSFTVKRLAGCYIEYTLYVEEKDENGEWKTVQERLYRLDEEWYDFVLNGPGGPSTSLFTDQTIAFTADTSELDADGIDYQIEWFFGHEYDEEGGFINPISGDFYTTSGTHNERIVIDGAKMSRNQKIANQGWVDLIAFAKAGDERIGRNRGKHIDLREVVENYDWPFSEKEPLLPGWRDSRWVDPYIHVYVENQEHPDGADYGVEVLNVAAENENPDKPAIEVRKEGDRYSISATENMGSARVIISYKDLKGNVQQYVSTFTVSGDAYYAWADVEDGYRHIHPGETLRVFAGVDHWYYREDEDEQYGGPEMPSAVYRFEIAEESRDILELAKQASDPLNACTIRGKKGANGGGRVIVHVLDGADNNREVASADTWIEVRNGYGRIEPARLEQSVKTQVVKPVFYDCYLDDNGKAIKEEVKNVRWRWDYDSNQVVVKDEKGKVAGRDKNGNYQYTSDSYGSGKAFTIERLTVDGTNVTLHVEVEEDGEWHEAWSEGTWLDQLEVRFDFVERLSNRWYPVPENRTVTIHVDTSNRAEGFDYKMEWTAFIYVDDQGNFEVIDDPDFMTVAPDGLSARFDGARMAKHEMLKDRGDVAFWVKEYLNGEEVWYTEYGLDLEQSAKPEPTVLKKLEDKKNGSLGIVWEDKGSQVDGYQVRWSTDKTFKTGTKTASYRGVSSAVRKGLEVGKTYYVSVRTFFEAEGNTTYSAWSAAKSIKLTAAVKSAVITGLFNSSKGGDLRWKAEDGAEKYVIMRTNGGKTETIATVDKSQTTYMDTSIKDNCWGKVYVYYVCSKAGSTVSARGEGKTLQRLAPMKINYCKNDKNGAAAVKWAVSSGTNKANGYELQYAESKDDLFGQKGTFRKTGLNGRNSLSKTISGLKKGKTYYFRVRAYVDYTHSVTKVTTKTWSQYSDVVNVKITK